MSWETIVKNNNLDVSEILFSELVGRVDAEYYKPIFIVGDKIIESKYTKKLSQIAEIKGGKRLPKGESFSAEGIPYIRAEDVKNSFVQYENSPKISVAMHQKLKSYQIKLNDVLVSIAGSVGDVGIVKFDIGKCNLTENCAKIIDLKEINPDYLFIFLLSKYGQNQIEREKVGSNQPKLALTRIRDFIIPIPSDAFQKGIASLVLKSKILKDTSMLEHSEVEQTLLKELNLDNHIASELSVSVRNLSECLRDDRFDAEYWQPEYDAMEKAVSRVAQKELGEIVSVLKGVEVGSESYDPEGKPFIRVSDFSIYGIEDVEKKISPELYDELKDKYTPKKGEVLFTKDGTIGLSYALHEETVGILSGAFLRLKPTIKINTDYLALVLNSLYCKTQIERMSGGAIIAHLKPESAKKIKIPLLSDTKQAEIAEKVFTAFRMRKEAKELVEKAKRAVEVFVEKDEKEAMVFISK